MGGKKLGHLSGHATVPSLYKVMGRIDDLRKLLKEDRDLTRQLDLYKCYFGLKVWRKLNQDKPDDERGLGDREEVWKIASMYPKDKKFALVRLYVVRQLMREKSFSYIFDGEKYWTRNRLETELEKNNRVIKELEKKK